MQIHFKRLVPDAVSPYKAHTDDAGFDLTCSSKESEDGIVTYHTGIAVDIPQGHVGFLFSRSSVYKTYQIQSNCVGVIDAGYHGEILVKFYATNKCRQYEVGDRVCQLVITEIPDITFEEVESFRPSERGVNGYGSTGN